MSKIIAVTTPKGGVGKTTTICGLGIFLANQSKKVLFIDLDNISSLTNNLLASKKEDYNETCNVTDLFKTLNNENNAKLKPTMINDYIDLIVGNANISNINKSIEFSTIFNLEDNIKKNIENIDQYDYILIDTPAGTGNTVFASLCCSDYIYSPIDLDVNALNSLNELAKLVETVSTRFNQKLKWLGFIINKVQKLIKNESENIIIPEANSDKIIYQSLIEAYGENYHLGTIGLRNSIKKNIGIGIWPEAIDNSSKEAIKELNNFYMNLLTKGS